MLHFAMTRLWHELMLFGKRVMAWRERSAEHWNLDEAR